MNLRKLLLVHAIITFAAGIMLIVKPALIPATVNIQLPPGAALLSYLLGAAELALAVLSFAAAKLTDRQSLHIIALTFIVFHLTTAAVEGYGMAGGASTRL